MPQCTIDGIQIEFAPGENLIEVAKRGGIEIPNFCYHPELCIVAQCRMCAVEIEKDTRIRTACSTQAVDGMIVYTKTEKVRKAQRATMEFLLINHPLDCPICDKAGECDLQDYSFRYGAPTSRYIEEKRTFLDLDMGPVIKKNMNRCIHCTRCIRFGAEIAKCREMIAHKRGNHVEISTLPGHELKTEYAGNYSDICPTGSLTLKDFRFKKRAWFLHKTPSTCVACSRGCAIEIQYENDRIYRVIARDNPSVNHHWICDEGRFFYHNVQHPDRIVHPLEPDLTPERRLTWNEALALFSRALSHEKWLMLVGTDLTQEELKLALEFQKANPAVEQIRHFGTPGIHESSQDADADALLKKKSKTANLIGAEKLGLKPFKGDAEDCTHVLVIKGERAVLPELKGCEMFGIGLFMRQEASRFRLILPLAAFTEKQGTIWNSQKMEQKILAVFPPREQSRPLQEIFKDLNQTAESTAVEFTAREEG